MSEPGKTQVPARWNGFTNDYPRNRCIPELFEEIARARPSALALIFGDVRLTYGELNARANQIAHYLQSLGVGPEVLVGICFERGVEMIVAMLAILKAGGAYVPLDPRYPADRLDFLIADTGLRTVLSDRVSKTKLPSQSAIGSPRILLLDGEDATWAQLAESNPDTAAGPLNLAYVIYTSGSTGRPKGVMIEHRAVIRLVRNTNFVNFDREYRFLQLAPISFDASIFEIWGALLNGASLVIMPAGVPSLAAIVATISLHGVSTAFFTPALFNMLVDADVNQLSSLKQIVVGGDVVSPRHFLRAIDHLPKCSLINGYGPTESTVFAVCYAASRESATREQIPIGYPIANTGAFILDRELKPVEVEATGELYLGGDGLARGYLNQPELTAENFIAISGVGTRLYRTGDLARFRSDGAIEFLGRVDAQLKISGYRVEPGEIVSVLRQHPEVRDAVVVVQAAGDAEVGSDRRLIAHVVGPTTLEHLALRDFLAARLPYYMIPASFHVLEVLPLTLNGKLDVARLPSSEHAGARAEDIASKPIDANFEDTIAAIWGKALRRTEVGRDENFFDAGGDSLRLIAMHAELSRMLSITLTIDDLFEHPTIASLAKWIEGERLVNPARESLRERVRKQHDSLRRRREAQAGS